MGPFPHSFNSSRLFSNKVSYPDTVNMSALAMETFWLNKSACDDAERAYYEKLSGCKGPSPSQLGLSEQIARARDHIKNSLESVDTLATGLSSSEEMALVKKLNALETENKQLKKVTDDLKALVLSLEARVGTLEGGKHARASRRMGWSGVPASWFQSVMESRGSRSCALLRMQRSPLKSLESKLKPLKIMFSQ